jgi:hypothetical protein
MSTPGIQIVQLIYSSNPSGEREEEDILRLRAFQEAAQVVQDHWRVRESELLWMLQEEKQNSKDWEEAAQDACKDLQRVRQSFAKAEEEFKLELACMQRELRVLQGENEKKTRELHETRASEAELMEELQRAMQEIQALKKENTRIQEEVNSCSNQRNLSMSSSPAEKELLENVESERLGLKECAANDLLEFFAEEEEEKEEDDIDRSLPLPRTFTVLDSRGGIDTEENSLLKLGRNNSEVECLSANELPLKEGRLDEKENSLVKPLENRTSFEPTDQISIATSDSDKNKSKHEEVRESPQDITLEMDSFANSVLDDDNNLKNDVLESLPKDFKKSGQPSNTTLCLTNAVLEKDREKSQTCSWSDSESKQDGSQGTADMEIFFGGGKESQDQVVMNDPDIESCSPLISVETRSKVGLLEGASPVPDEKVVGGQHILGLNMEWTKTANQPKGNQVSSASAPSIMAEQGNALELERHPARADDKENMKWGTICFIYFIYLIAVLASRKLF